MKSALTKTAGAARPRLPLERPAAYALVCVPAAVAPRPATMLGAANRRKGPTDAERRSEQACKAEALARRLRREADACGVTAPAGADCRRYEHAAGQLRALARELRAADGGGHTRAALSRPAR